MFYFHLFNALINPQAVALMHHIVSHFQIIKIVDLLAFIYFFLSLFLLLCAKNIALCNHHKLQKRIFKTLSDSPVSRHHFPRLHLTHGIFRIKGVQLLIPQILRQTFGACSRPGKQQNAVPFFLIIFQILHQRLKAVIVRRQAPRLHGKLLLRLHKRIFPFHRGKAHNPSVFQPCCH